MNAETIGEILKSHRLKANLKLHEAANLLSVSKAYISAIEHDKKLPNAVLVKKMRDLYKISEPDWVFIVYSIDDCLSSKFWGKK